MSLFPFAITEYEKEGKFVMLQEVDDTSEIRGHVTMLNTLKHYQVSPWQQNMVYNHNIAKNHNCWFIFNRFGLHFFLFTTSSDNWKKFYWQVKYKKLNQNVICCM